MPRFDKDKVLKGILSSAEPAPVITEPEIEASTEEIKKKPGEKIIPEARGKGEKERESKYVQISAYLTPEQRKKLKIRAATSDNPKEKDISSIIRNALDTYFK